MCCTATKLKYRVSVLKQMCPCALVVLLCAAVCWCMSTCVPMSVCVSVCLRVCLCIERRMSEDRAEESAAVVQSSVIRLKADMHAEFIKGV